MRNDKENIIVEKTINFSLSINIVKFLNKLENMLLQNSYYDLLHQLGQMYLKRKTQKVKLILYIKWKLLLKKPAKLFIGWYYAKEVKGINLIKGSELTWMSWLGFFQKLFHRQKGEFWLFLGNFMGIFKFSNSQINTFNFYGTLFNES